jgi:hypothetical protein
VKGQVLRDMQRADWEVALDDLGEQVFAGTGRADPLLARFAAEVGQYAGLDEGYLTLQAARVDWALCEAQIGGPGETWALRAATGRVPGIEPSPVAWALATSQVGLFEVWQGTPLLLRDRLRGLCVHVHEPAPWLGEGRRLAALWEVRVVILPEGARLCRPPIEYPLAIAPLLQRAHERHWRTPGAIDLQRLRRARLLWSRDRKGEAREYFKFLG